LVVEGAEKSSAWVAVTRGPEQGKLKNLHETVTREWLVKIKQAGKA
jgi:hypothetical protein